MRVTALKRKKKSEKSIAGESEPPKEVAVDPGATGFEIGVEMASNLIRSRLKRLKGSGATPYESFFNMCDADGSGEVSLEEFLTCLRSNAVGVPASVLTDRDCRSVFVHEMNADGNGELDLEELVAWIETGEKLSNTKGKDGEKENKADEEEETSVVNKTTTIEELGADIVSSSEDDEDTEQLVLPEARRIELLSRQTQIRLNALYDRLCFEGVTRLPEQYTADMPLDALDENDNDGNKGHVQSNIAEVEMVVHALIESVASVQAKVDIAASWQKEVEEKKMAAEGKEARDPTPSASNRTSRRITLDLIPGPRPEDASSPPFARFHPKTVSSTANAAIRGTHLVDPKRAKIYEGFAERAAGAAIV